jgi:hypothetical protein
MAAWLQDDIRGILAALAAAGESRGPDYRLALYHVALAFGVEEQPSTIDAEGYRRSGPEPWKSTARTASSIHELEAKRNE